MNYLKLNVLLRIYSVESKFKYFINPGASIGMLFSETNYLTIEDVFYSTTTKYDGTLLNEIKKVEFDILLGFGGKFNNVRLELRVSRGSGISANDKLKNSVYRGHLFFSYYF